MDMESLLKTHSSKVYNLAYRITNNIQDAEDIVQATFLKVFEKMDTFRGESDISTWIYRIALNEGLGVVRKLHLDQAHFDQVDEEMNHSSVEDLPADIRDIYTSPDKQYLLKLMENEIKEGCHKFMLFRITEEQRVVFIFRIILDFSLKEISEILQIDIGSVKSRLSRAKQNLQKHVKDRCQWHNEKADCSCVKCMGFAFKETPDLIYRMRDIINRPEYYREAAEQVNSRGDLEDIFHRLPRLEYKILPIQKYLKKTL